MKINDLLNNEELTAAFDGNPNCPGYDPNKDEPIQPAYDSDYEADSKITFRMLQKNFPI